MKHTAAFGVILASMLSFYACEDSTSQSGELSPSPEPVEDTAARIGETCGGSTQCESGLDCRGSKCVVVASVGDQCDDVHVCDKGLKCEEGHCRKTESDVGETCGGDADCKSPLKCHDGRCLKESAIGDGCDSTAYCMDGVCEEDGICRHYGIEGEECDGDVRKCKENILCGNGYCYIPGELGSECDDRRLCMDSYECEYISGKCMIRGMLGDDCSEGLSVFCDFMQGLSCIDNKCRMPVYGQSECSDLMPCAEENTVCNDGKCIEKVDCSSDSECQADTYCCLEDTCEVKGVCIPYGTGPKGTTNEACLYKTAPGIFEADVQCEWAPTSGSVNIVTPVFVGKTPHDMKGANALIVGTYANGSVTNAAGTSIDEAQGHSTVIRIFNSETCELVETISDPDNRVSSGASPAIGDIDGDGYVEIFTQRSRYQTENSNYGGIVAFKWSSDENKYVMVWTAYKDLKVKDYAWGGFSLHDVNDDGVAELINPAGEVLDARTGKKLNGTQSFSTTYFPLVEDLDNDKKVEFIDYKGNVYEWLIELDENNAIKSQSWVLEYPTVEASHGYRLKAVGDFGTPGATPEDFDWEHLDGIAEIVFTRGNEVGKDKAQFAIHALTKNTVDGNEVKAQQRLIYLEKLFGGGAPTIGDYDGDTLPEVGVAFGDYYTVFDPRCRKDASGQLPAGCLEEYILWKQPCVDNSSYTTGSSVFDFDGDGQIEVVYADECYTRIYDGKSGDVLFSEKHSSRTAFEMPIIADVDNDESAEIIMGANLTDRTCPTLDTIHRGVQCQHNNECRSKICEDGFCRCSDSKTDCNVNYACTDPLAGDAAVNSKKVCRAERPQKKTISGLRVMRDKFDRWVSSRNLWNQFNYSIMNINDDMSIPQTSKWTPNFLTAGLNNYRANAQGKVGMNAAPDITGKLDKDNLCVKGKDDKVVLHGVVCNRGTKMVASKMPASFYLVNEDGSIGKKYCTAYTTENVPVGGCLEVTCELDEILENRTVRMISNDDGEGGRTTVECNEDNNADEVLLSQCQVEIS